MPKPSFTDSIQRKLRLARKPNLSLQEAIAKTREEDRPGWADVWDSIDELEAAAKRLYALMSNGKASAALTEMWRETVFMRRKLVVQEQHRPATLQEWYKVVTYQPMGDTLDRVKTYQIQQRG